MLGKRVYRIVDIAGDTRRRESTMRITKGWQCETGIHAGELREERRVTPYGTDSP